MNDTLVREWLLENSSYVVNSDIITDALHSIGWMLVKLLQSLADACESLYRVVFQLIDFTTWDSLENFLSQFRYAFTAFLALALFALGIMLIFNHEKKPKIIINLCLAAFILCGSTAVLSGINDALKVWNNALLDTQTTSSCELIRGSMLDWLYIDDTASIAGINSDNIESHVYPSVTDRDIEMIDINETIDYDEADISADAQSIFSQKLVYAYGADGKLAEVSDGVLGTGIFSEFYYRYHIDFFTLYLKLLALLIVYLCMAYKVVRLIIEIVQARVVSVLYAADMTSHQKTARILCAIRDSYFVLLLITVFVKIYILAQLYIDTQIDAGALVKAIMTLFLAFAIIDGPNFIQQLTGVDAGLQSGFGKLYAAAKGSEMLASVFSHGVHTASNVARHSMAAAGHHHVSSTERDNTMQDREGTDTDHVSSAYSRDETTDTNDPNMAASMDAATMSASAEGPDNSSGTDIPAGTSPDSTSPGDGDTERSADTDISAGASPAGTAPGMDSRDEAYIQASRHVDPDIDGQNPSDDPLHTFNPEGAPSSSDHTFEKMDADLHSPDTGSTYGSSGMEKENIVHYRHTQDSPLPRERHAPGTGNTPSDTPKGAK